MHRSLSFQRRLLASVSALVGLAAASPVLAQQAIERNLPPPPAEAPAAILAPKALPQDQDATPIGPPLRAIVLLGVEDTPISDARGVDTSRVPRLARSAGAFKQFLGRRLSKKLIAEVEAEVARLYRDKDHPFVSVSTPPQEITAGVLQVRALEFHLGTKTAPGASPGATPYIESRVRAQPGQPIEASALAQDLDWLNRYPFRRTEAVLTPGDGLGVTDLQLRTNASKPWSVYLGYSNSGSPLTGWDRYFAGFQAALPGLHDALLAYQFTGSNDALFDKGRLFDAAADPAYISHAGRLIIPTLARQDLELSISYVQSNEPVQAFLVRQTTYEATVAYRSALSNAWDVLPGEGVMGVELKRQTSQTLFGGAVALASSFDVFQVTLGYARQEVDARGRTSGELTLHLSPGGVNDQNTAAVFRTFSQGRFDEPRYAYLSGDLSRYTQLPSFFGIRGWGLANTVIGQYSAVPLPLTEEMGLGSNSLVRGYTLDDGAFDEGVISRNELRMPAFPVIGRGGWAGDLLSPYLFLDAGYGKDHYTKADAAPASTGLGADYQLASHLTATVDGAWALRSAGATHAGEIRLESRVTLTF